MAKETKIAPETKNTNMGLWLQVCKTNPAHTKQVNQRGGFTAVCAQSRVKKATELWGPMGHKWGVVDEFFTILEPYDLCIYRASLYYPADGEIGRICIHSSIEVKSAKGKIDDDFAKKVATDALTKGLSKLGFSSDVFEGLYDDSKYVAAMRDEFKEPPKEVKVADNLPPLTPENVKSMNLIAKWVAENTKNGSKIAPAELAKSVYAILGHWPETVADEKHVLENLSIEKAAA